MGRKELNSALINVGHLTIIIKMNGYVLELWLTQGGAIGELLVCADLLSKGYEVFRAQSPACSCDLVAAKDGKLIRIEVRTGKETRTNLIATSRRKLRADVLAIVLKDRIVYEGITGSLEEFQWPETGS